ncbi:2-oxo acid dehydrogenase subunit E2 [Streptomyces sp. 8ZJF_21]|uniref:2-oxo acid dehydrogenase subunit E2 n=1 Tax=Streptomyces sp. 8ZJF_21 TaxID=2903141 RepID=UPI001E62257E|nr:2-oxo acid dehydrogenase subunit E2 [Streptomyces sp. 8ZJF_21]MCD9587289.1 2-oxo acid dehydrogenase subunit E2 [Streptomyces sp. 8ZJF_21]
MTAVRVPKFNSNDAAYLLLEWVVEDGETVTDGQEIALLETSKAVVELNSPGDGVLEQKAEAHTECAVGDPVAVLHPDRTAYERGATPVAPPNAPAGPSAPPCSVTRGARELAEERGIPLERLYALGRKVVRRSHVEDLLAKAAGRAHRPGETDAPGPQGNGMAPPGAGTDEAVDGPTEPLSAVQRAVAATVSESHRTVPTAFVAVRVGVDAALEHAARLSRSERALIGLPELLVAAIAAVRTRFPHCFATLVGEDAVRVRPAAHVGVTIDTGNGLFVATVRDAETLTPADIAHRLMEFRLRSLRGGFRAEHLADSAVALSLHTEDDVVLARPIVFPGHTCSVALPGVLDEVVLDADGAPRRRRVVNLGLAYDHRVLNGRTAMAFLRALKEFLESPALPAAPAPEPSEAP